MLVHSIDKYTRLWFIDAMLQCINLHKVVFLFLKQLFCNPAADDGQCTNYNVPFETFTITVDGADIAILMFLCVFSEWGRGGIRMPCNC